MSKTRLDKATIKHNTTQKGKILTVRGSLSLALGLSDDTPVLHRLKTKKMGKVISVHVLFTAAAAFLSTRLFFLPVYRAILSISSLI